MWDCSHFITSVLYPTNIPMNSNEGLAGAYIGMASVFLLTHNYFKIIRLFLYRLSYHFFEEYGFVSLI